MQNRADFCILQNHAVFASVVLINDVLLISLRLYLYELYTNYIRIIYELYDFDSRHSNVIRSFIQSAVLTLPSSSHLTPNHPNPV